MSAVRTRQMPLFVVEGAVAVNVSVLLAGLWLGAPYQPPHFVSGCVFCTSVLCVAVLGYAVVTRRLWVLLTLEAFGLAILFPPIVIVAPLLTGVVGVPIALVRALLRWTRGRWLLGQETARVVHNGTRMQPIEG